MSNCKGNMQTGKGRNGEKKSEQRKKNRVLVAKIEKVEVNNQLDEVEVAEEVDENFGIEKVVYKESTYTGPRSKPVPIRQPERMLYPFGIEEDNVWIGSYRNLKQYELFEQKLSAEMSESYTNVYKQFKEKVERLTKRELMSQLILMTAQDATYFYFDYETLTLIPEDDFEKMFLMCADDDEEEEELHVPREKEKHYEFNDYMRGRHRHSGNEKVHPKDLYTSYSRAVPFFPTRQPMDIFESGYCSEDEDDFFPEVDHPQYGRILPFVLARQRALDSKVHNLETELLRGSDMDRIRVNRLIRLFADDEEDITNVPSTSKAH